MPGGRFSGNLMPAIMLASRARREAMRRQQYAALYAMILRL